MPKAPLIYWNPSPNRDEVWFQFCQDRIAEAASRDDWKRAQDVALDWANGVCERYGIDTSPVWKFAKRSIAARWFGPVEYKRFQPGWTVTDILEYTRSLHDRSLRISVFPNTIAFHANSIELHRKYQADWPAIIDGIDNMFAVEVFPESSTAHTICFRRFSTRFSEIVFYEASRGQAMYAFEQDQGHHRIVGAKRAANGWQFVYSGASSLSSWSFGQIERKLSTLIRTRDYDLDSRCRNLCRSLGIDQVSIEGYFDPEELHYLPIVDIDLPFDFVFHH